MCCKDFVPAACFLSLTIFLTADGWNAGQADDIRRLAGG